MSTGTKRLPLIDLPIGQKRELGSLQVERTGKKCLLPLVGVDISAKVADRVASVTVKQTFRNQFNEHLEAVYIFPLSGGCVVNDFEMRVGTRVVKGVVQERAKARMEYQQALQQGKRAALLEQERDDVFTMQVGNIPPNEEITVTLIYSERLPFFESGKTELRLPLVVAPRYIPGDAIDDRDNVGGGTSTDTDQVPDASRISPPRLVPGASGNVALKLQVEISTSDASGTEGVSELACSQHATQLGIDTNTVKVELAREDERLNRDFVLQWRLATGAVRSSMLIYKAKNVESGFAMLSITPPKRDGYTGAPRDVVFVLDRSGSMGGLKMTSAARACAILLSTLGPKDRFAIQAFDTVVEWLTLPDRSGWDSRWVEADESGLARGEKFLRGIDSRGGTEMHMALTEAFAGIGARTQTSGRVPVVVVLTDGEVGNESAILKLTQTQLGEARLFVVGIDTAANSGLLRRLANLGGGTSAFVSPGSHLEQALVSVGREIGAPMITDLELISEGSAIEADSISPARLPDLFEGRAVTAFFKVTGKGSIRVKGRWSDGKVFDEKVKSRTCSVPAVAQLWAKSVITDLEDQFRMQPNDALRKRIIDLSVAHSLLTKFTAFVAVDHAEVVNKDGTLRQVVQPVEQPVGWTVDAQQSASLLESIAVPDMTFGRARAQSVAEGGSGGSWGSPANFSSTDAGWGSSANIGSVNDGWGAPPAGPAGGAKREQPPMFGSPAPKSQPLKDSNPIRPKLRDNSKSDESAPNVSAAFNRMLGAGPGDATDAEYHSSTPDSRLKAVKYSESCAAFEKFAEVIGRLYSMISQGTLPSSSDLAEFEAIRKQLLDALGREACGTNVPLLQKFLRGAAVELIESVKQSTGTAAGAQPIWDRHMQAFSSAEAEATTQLTGTSSGSRFWEASV